MNTEIFNKMAERYDTPRQEALAAIIRQKLLDSLPDLSDKRVLDLGCGTGLVSLPLVARAKQAYLIDLSEAMVAISREKVAQAKFDHIQVLQHDVIAQPLDEEVDIILVSLVLLHIPDSLAIMQAIYRQLAPGGQVFIVDIDENPLVNHPKIHSGFSHTNLKNLLQQAGFETIEIANFYHGQNIFANQDADLLLAKARKPE